MSATIRQPALFDDGPAKAVRDADALSVALGCLRSGVFRIDDEGRIWRCGVRCGDAPMAPVGPRRAESASGKGYLRVVLGMPGHRTASVQAHRLVWTWLHGPIPDGKQINHKNLDKHDNRPANLEVVTGAENIQHSYRNGRTAPWSRRGRTGVWAGGPLGVSKPVLTDAQVEAIRARRRAGALFREIAVEFPISITHAHRLCAQ